MPRTKTNQADTFLNNLKEAKPSTYVSDNQRIVFTKERNPTMYYVELWGDYGSGLVKYGNFQVNILSRILTDTKKEIDTFTKN